jgi:hypothetical protein
MYEMVDWKLSIIHIQMSFGIIIHIVLGYDRVATRVLNFAWIQNLVGGLQKSWNSRFQTSVLKLFWEISRITTHENDFW